MAKKDYKIIDDVLIIDEGRKEIKTHEFFNKKFVKVIIPEGVEKIGYWAFGACERLEEVIFPSTLISIEMQAFALCNLKKLTFTDGCPKLKEVCHSSFGSDCLWFNQQLEQNEFTILGKVLFLHGIGSNHVLVPNNVEIIASDSFNSQLIESVILPEGVKVIENAAFARCEKLQSIILPRSLETIGNGSFHSCKMLKEIVIPNKVKKIGDNAFRSCSNLEKIILPSKLKSIGENAFAINIDENLLDFNVLEGIVPALLNGCKINNNTLLWQLDNRWDNEQFIKEVVLIYLTQSGKKVLDKATLILMRNYDIAISAMKEYQNCYELKPKIIEKINSFIEEYA
ncbi:MAG: leucine-rich repeat protein [Bacilli bacterium]|nr:leucine-rich repeat protein [Bacilli bacterium]